MIHQNDNYQIRFFTDDEPYKSIVKDSGFLGFANEIRFVIINKTNKPDWF